MDKDGEKLSYFLSRFKDLIKVVGQCSPVLFRKEFRENLNKVFKNDVDEQLEFESLGPEERNMLENPDDYPEMHQAGLTASQLDLKLESFSFSFSAFVETGLQDDLVAALEKAETVLQSLAGAIPGFGSFAQELVGVILKELKKWPFRWLM